MNTPHDDTDNEVGFGLKRMAWAGVGAILLVAGTVGAWAVGTTISGAVVASGSFVVDGNVKKVQHPTGGIVGELRVAEGARVKKDDVLIRLDETVTRANLLVLTKQLDEFSARRARLVAERDGKEAISIPTELQARLAEPAIEEMLDAEAALFKARRMARDGQKAQLTKRVSQLRDEIAGLKSQQEGRERQSILIEEELIGVRTLYQKNLVAISRKSALEREAANLLGQKGQIQATVAQTEGKIAETELQVIQIDDAMREEVMKELRELQARVAEFAERRIAAEDQLNRVEIRAPISGYVHQLAVHTVGGVITPAEPAMLIVPEEDSLQVEVRVLPQDVDQIAVGSAARVKIHAFNQRTTPELFGHVRRISADVSRDQQTGVSFYTVRVGLDADQIERLGGKKVTAGMQADVYVTTEERTPMDFLMKPLVDQVSKAFRER